LQGANLTNADPDRMKMAKITEFGVYFSGALGVVAVLFLINSVRKLRALNRDIT
jgi:hypothetical protein